MKNKNPKMNQISKQQSYKYQPSYREQHQQQYKIDNRAVDKNNWFKVVKKQEIKRWTSLQCHKERKYREDNPEKYYDREKKYFEKQEEKKWQWKERKEEKERGVKYQEKIYVKETKHEVDLDDKHRKSWDNTRQDQNIAEALIIKDIKLGDNYKKIQIVDQPNTHKCQQLSLSPLRNQIQTQTNLHTPINYTTISSTPQIQQISNQPTANNTNSVIEKIQINLQYTPARHKSPKPTITKLFITQHQSMTSMKSMQSLTRITMNSPNKINNIPVNSNRQIHKTKLKQYQQQKITKILALIEQAQSNPMKQLQIQFQCKFNITNVAIKTVHILPLDLDLELSTINNKIQANCQIDKNKLSKYIQFVQINHQYPRIYSSRTSFNRHILCRLRLSSSFITDNLCLNNPTLILKQMIQIKSLQLKCFCSYINFVPLLSNQTAYLSCIMCSNPLQIAINKLIALNQ